MKMAEKEDRMKNLFIALTGRLENGKAARLERVMRSRM